MGHLNSFLASGGGNLITSLDFMLRVVIPRGVISHAEDKPSCIQSERYPIRGGLAEKHKLCSVFEGIHEPFVLFAACKSVVYKPCFNTYTASGA